jgi:Iap family predicted aminopeptidase
MSHVTPQAILVSDWLISKISSPLKPICQMNRNMVGSILERSSIKIAHLVPIRLQTWPQEKIFLEIKQSETAIAYGGHVC